jgi:molecular chaperone DnaJ
MVIQVEVETRRLSAARRIAGGIRKTETGEECPASAGFFTKLRGLWDG